MQLIAMIWSKKIAKKAKGKNEKRNRNHNHRVGTELGIGFRIAHINSPLRF